MSIGCSEPFSDFPFDSIQTGRLICNYGTQLTGSIREISNTPKLGMTIPQSPNKKGSQNTPSFLPERVSGLNPPMDTVIAGFTAFDTEGGHQGWPLITISVLLIAVRGELPARKADKPEVDVRVERLLSLS